MDRDSHTALRQQISLRLEHTVIKHEIQPGQTIEDEAFLAGRLKIPRLMVRRALQDLTARGLPSHRRGVDIRVSSTPVQRQVKLSSLNSDLTCVGHTTHTEVLRHKVRFTDDNISEKPDCEIGGKTVFFRRLRWLDNSRFTSMHNYVPSDITPLLTDLARDGFYQYLVQSEVQLQSGYQQVGAKSITGHEVKTLHVNPVAALITTKRTAYGKTGRIIGYASHCYDAAQCAITMPLVVA